MGKRFAVVTAFLVALAFNVGCGVHQTEAPALSGPSEQSTSFLLTAIPDSISQDGASQSSVTVFVRDANARPIQGLSMRLDMAVGGTTQDFGTLSARTVVTGSDGKAFAIYTAPSPPPASQGGSSTHVQVEVRPVGSNAQTTILQTVDIRLVPPGVISAPAGTPVAAFTISPTPVVVDVPVTFDASSSSAGTGANSITSYAWNFGDSTTGTGKAVSHTFSAAGTYSVTVTVTNDRGLSASSTLPVTVGAGAVVGGALSPTAKFTSSPASPTVNQSVFFNGSSSTPAAGHTLTGYAWDFGDGSTATGATPTHVYAAPGGFTVTLIVTDDAGHTGTTSGTVTVTSAGGGGGGPTAPTATFTFSPSSPGVNQTVFFNASTSSPGTGHTIASYAWTFGDGASGTGLSPTHAYVTSGSYGVQLTVTDEVNQSTTSAPTSISVGSNSLDPSANFTFSPSSPGRNDQVVFDASSSTIAQGQTITDVAWNFGDGTAIVHCPGGNSTDCPGPTNRISAHTFTTNQTFTVNLVVTDSALRTGARNTSVTVALAQPTVVITTSPSSPNPTNVVFFNSNGTTYYPGSGAGSFSWTFGDGGSCSTAFPAGCGAGTPANPTHPYAAVGTYGVGLSVTDNKTCSPPACTPAQPGRTGTGTATVTVVAVTPPAAPTAAFTFSPPNPGVAAATNTVTFDAGTSLRPSGAAISNYRWNFGDATPVVNTASVTTPHAYLAAGTYTVTLIVTDTNALSGNTTGAVTVVP